MPAKKIHKPKTRAYMNTLLDNAGLSDKDMAKAIKEGITSDNPSERSKALDMAAQWKGFADVDKRAGDDIEALPLANVKLEDLDRLANRCSYCKHKKFEPIRGGKSAEPTEQVGESDNGGVLITLERLVAGEPAAEELMKDKEEPPAIPVTEISPLIHGNPDSMTADENAKDTIK